MRNKVSKYGNYTYSVIHSCVVDPKLIIRSGSVQEISDPDPAPDPILDPT